LAEGPHRPATQEGRSDTMRGVLWMLVAVAGLAGVVLAARGLKPDIHVFELLLFRAFIGLIAATALTLPRGWRGMITRRPGLHLVRNLFHVCAQYGIFFAIITVPLAQVTAIEYTIPAMTAAFAALTIGEKVGRHRWIGMAVSFIGVLFVVRPVLDTIPPAMLVAILGAVCFALNNVMIRVLSRIDSAGTMVFTMNLIQSVLLLGPAIYVAIYVWTTPGWSHLPLILLLGLAGVVTHYCMSRALALADTSVCFPLDFLRLPFVAAIAWLAWGETFSPWTAVGAAIIFGSSYYAIARERTAGRP
jgi:drug/metabolite transporter (DMT)-like permease